ncbi:MAG: hypothetical protein P9X24_00125 [Candidatus Hatepunaea meridiana]|nr:hypothetical protein [Candidatus Hatepunaea meridiana]
MRLLRFARNDVTFKKHYKVSQSGVDVNDLSECLYRNRSELSDELFNDIVFFGYAFSSAMYKPNNTGVAKLAAFLHCGACVSACERAASCATPAELKA